MASDGTPVPNRLVAMPQALYDELDAVLASHGIHSHAVQANRLRHVVGRAYRAGYMDGYRDGHTDAENGHDESVRAGI